VKKIHKGCGGTVVDDLAINATRCLKCKAQWSDQQLRMMSWRRRDDLFETVFADYVAPDHEPRYKLEEVQDGRVRYTRLRRL
jgi:hypothetical protein